MQTSDLNILGLISVFLEDFRDAYFLRQDGLVVIFSSSEICAFKVHFHFHNRGSFWLLSFEYNPPETLCFHNTTKKKKNTHFKHFSATKCEKLKESVNILIALSSALN